MRPAKGFAGYQCWDETAVKDTVFVDAASPSEAVFVATHQPPLILRRPFGGQEGGVHVTEHELLQEFMRPDVDMMLLPIIGEAGTGKSHLVRWLYARQDKEDSTRKVIYVPKQGTSLRRVLYLILEQMEGPEADSLRAELDEAQDLDERTAHDDLLDALARRVRLIVADMDDSHADYTALAKLPDLLQDPFFRPQFTAEGTLIRRFVERAIKGSRQGDEGEAFLFSPTDFPTGISAKDASLRAREAIEGLRWPKRAEVAARVLTEQLGPALQGVFGLEGTTTLHDVMVRTRQSLAEQDKELVLLIEDFTVLQGIQRDLLDALTLPPVQNGIRVLCPIRVSLAVTSGYWDTLADTVATRARFMTHVYDLNVPMGSNPEEGAPGAAMIGRYLNAARRGGPEIERRWGEATKAEIHADKWLGNACTDCQVKEECHPAFGKSPDGFGLYPFNVQALQRMVATVSDEAYFDPRAVLGQVVRRTLESYAADIREGEFPSKDYGEAFADPARRLRDLPADVRYALREYPDHERREVLLRIWGGAPDAVVDLHQGIHKAFQIPMIGQAHIEDEHKPPPPPPPPPPGSALSRGLAQIDAWSAGTGVMDDGVARQLRQALHEAVLARIDWDSELLHKGANSVSEVLTQASFILEGRAAGGRTPGARVWTCRIAPEDSTGTMLRGVLRSRSSEGTRTWDFPGGEDAYALYCNSLDHWAAEVADAVRKDIGLVDATTTGLAVTSLAVGAAVLGLPASGGDEALLAAALLPITPEVVARARARGGLLSRAGTAATAQRRQETVDALMHSAGARQGGGRVHALDAAAFADALNALSSSEDVVELLGDPADPFAASLAQELPGAVESELADLAALQQTLIALLGEDRDAASLSQSLRGSVTAAGTAMVFSPGHELSACLALCDDIARLPLDLLDEVAALRSAATGVGQAELIARLGRFPRSEFVQMHDTLRKISRYFEGSLRLAENRKAGAASGGGASDLEGVLRALSEMTQSLVDL